MLCCRRRFWIPIFEFHLHFAVAAPNGPPGPPDRPRSPSENRDHKEAKCLGIIWKNGAHQVDDDDREEEDIKVRDDNIELPCIKERRPSHAC